MTFQQRLCFCALNPIGHFPLVFISCRGRKVPCHPDPREEVRPCHPELVEGSLLNIVKISIEILRLRRPAGGSAQDDKKRSSDFTAPNSVRRYSVAAAGQRIATCIQIIICADPINSASRFGSETRAEQGRRGFARGAYTDVRDPLQNASLTQLCDAYPRRISVRRCKQDEENEDFPREFTKT